MPRLKTIARRAVGLFNLRKAPVRARIARAWVDQRMRQMRDADQSSLAAEIDATGRNFNAWLENVRGSSRTYASLALDSVDRLVAAEPAVKAQCVRQAEAIMGHNFDLLGSGPFHPRCPRRATDSDGYHFIDWYLDPVRGLRFPERVPYRDWNLFRDRPENADVKYPWELGRCQHFFTLAQAWKLTGDSRFAREIFDEIADFEEANPVGEGVNWTCTMDVGIRAANWAIALDLVRDCPDISDDDFFEAYNALFSHGRFIRANLENTYEVTSNHFLSNIVGLDFIAATFHDLPAGAAWQGFCRECLEREVDVQILPDGADFESSIPYHRLVIELFLGSWRLSQQFGRPLSEHYRQRLTDMMDYLVGVLCPNGEMPVLGDADDGRLHIATDYCGWNRKDPRHLLGPAGFALGRPDWFEISPQYGRWEAAWWGFDGAGMQAGALPPADNATLYPEAGVAISRRRDGGRYLMASNSIVGTKGFGNHKNCDQLSFEYHDEGAPLIVDPGSYVYTSDFEARNLFRSTAYHNTVQVDGGEQQEFNPEWLFRMFEKAEPEHLSFDVEGDKVVYEGVHHGFANVFDDTRTKLTRNVPDGVVHRRRFEHNRADGALDIHDFLSGSGAHDLSWAFHLHPTVEVTLEGHSARLVAGRRSWRLRWDDSGVLARVEDSWNSPSYGVRTPSHAIRLTRPNTRMADGYSCSFSIRREP